MALNLKHQTAAQFLARFREAYRNGERERLARLAKWLQARIVAGDLTETQARNAFGLNETQWNNLKSRMQTLVQNYDAVQAAAGE